VQCCNVSELKCFYIFLWPLLMEVEILKALFCITDKQISVVFSYKARGISDGNEKIKRRNWLHASISWTTWKPGSCRYATSTEARIHG